MDFPDRRELREKFRTQHTNTKNDLQKSIIDEDGFNREVKSNISEKQKTYTWMRLYLNNEHVIQPGKMVTMKHAPSGDELNITFGAYNKKNLHKDLDEEVVEYTSEDDKKCLCLMVDIEEVNSNPDITFLRTLFKDGRFFDSNNLLIRDGEITFSVDSTELEYYSVDF